MATGYPEPYIFHRYSFYLLLVYTKGLFLFSRRFVYYAANQR